MMIWRKGSTRLGFAVFMLALFAVASMAQTPDTEKLLQGSSVREQDGWKIIHLEGNSYQLGFQHGYLASESVKYIIDTYLGESGSEYRERCRNIAREIVWNKVPGEFQEEIRGIAEGAVAAGVACDLWDIVAVNDWADQAAYEEYYDKMRESDGKDGERCSAFIATGSATADGSIVMGHNTWASYNEDFMYNYFFDVKPEQGHRFVYQTSGAAIWSGEEWYMNDAGLMVTATALNNDTVDPEGIPDFVRIRQAVQYTDNLDDFIRVFTSNVDGGDPAEWLVGDAKTGEIASIQLGCKAADVNRTRDGFFGSTNYAWGPDFRKEAGLTEPTDPGHYGYARWLRMKELEKEYSGKIDVEAGKAILSDHYDTFLGKESPSARTICGHREAETVDKGQMRPSGAYDGKVVTSGGLEGGVNFWARWGHPCGTPFRTDEFLASHPGWAEDHGDQAVAYLRLFEASTPQAWSSISIPWDF